MAFSAKTKGCLKSVLNLKDEEVTELLDRSAAIRAADPSIGEDQALVQAVQQAVSSMRGTATPEAGTAVSDMAAQLTGQATKRKEATSEIARKAADDFLAKVEAAKSSGEITANDEERLLNLALGGERGRQRAKDELLRLREEHVERKSDQADAEKLWNDPDWMYQEGDPKFSDLSEASKAKWTKAAKAEKTTIDLYDELVKEQKLVESLPKVNDANDPLLANPSAVSSEGVRVIKADSPEMANGHTAIEFIAKNSLADWVRGIAKSVAEFIPADVPIIYLHQGEKYQLPPNAVKLIRGGSAAVAILDKNGGQAIYAKVNANGTVNEEYILHELIHIATQKALYGTKNIILRAELQNILAAVQKSLAEIKTPGAEHFGKVVNNEHELFAYAYSSQPFREFLKTLKADGSSFTPEDLQGNSAAVAKILRKTDVEAPSLWQRIVDWVAKLLGIEPPFQARFEKLIDSANNEVVKFLEANVDPGLYSRLDGLLLKTMQATKEADNEGQTSESPATPTPPGQKSDASTNVAKNLNLPDFEPGNRFATRLKDWSGGWRNKPGMLGWLTLRQIADRFKDVPGVTEFAELSSRMGAKAKTLMSEAHSVDMDWAKLKQDEAIEVQKLMLESTMEQMWPDRALISEANHMLDKSSAAVQAKHAALSRRYRAMNETQQRVFQNAQAKMRKDWDERGRLLRTRIIDQYRAELHHSFAGEKLDALAAIHKDDREKALEGLTRNEVRSIKSLWSDLDEHAERLSQMQGPYFPLVRFGQHVVVAKSSDLNTASEAFDEARDKLEALNEDEDSTDAAIAAARKEVTAAKEALDGLKDSEKHYIVEFYESPSEARAREKQLKDYFASKGTPMQVYSERRQDHFAKMDSVSPAFMKKLETALSANLPDKDANAIRAAVRDLYIQSLPERSALKSQLRRLGVKGVKAGEMRRAFSAAAMRGAWHLSRLEFGAGMQQKLVELRTGDSDDQRIVGGELARRLVAAFQQDEPSLLAERLSNISYLTYLGMSPSFFVMNATQPWAISLPIMAAKYGVKRASSELGKAFNETAAAMIASAKDQKTWRFELNLEAFKDENERAMLNELFNKGIIDVTIEHDLGSIASGDDVGRFGKVMQLATLPAHHTEVVNRVMTALAAYRLASTPGLTGKATSHAEATKYAEEVVADTHLDYTPENAPRFMRTASMGGLGRIVFQFKKYMQGMLFLMGKLAADAARGDKESGKALVYLMGMQLAVAGSAGLPVAAPVGLLLAALAKLWPDDDEPEISQLFWNGVEDAIGTAGMRALRKGLPAALGVDVSGRLGFGQILNPVAFTPPGKEGRDYVAAALLALAGPAASMVANWAEALVVAKDDPVKAAMTALPKTLADPIRAVDRANRGVTNKRGATLISADEFGPLALAMRAIGFESTDVTDMYDKRGAFMEAKTSRDDTRKRLIAAVAQDRISGEDASASLEAVQEFNTRHHDDKITGASLQEAVKQRKAQGRQMKSGVLVRKQDRQLAQELGVE
jgi:hypothetical protein